MRVPLTVLPAAAHPRVLKTVGTAKKLRAFGRITGWGVSKIRTWLAETRAYGLPVYDNIDAGIISLPWLVARAECKVHASILKNANHLLAASGVVDAGLSFGDERARPSPPQKSIRIRGENVDLKDVENAGPVLRALRETGAMAWAFNTAATLFDGAGKPAIGFRESFPTGEPTHIFVVQYEAGKEHGTTAAGAPANFCKWLQASLRTWTGRPRPWCGKSARRQKTSTRHYPSLVVLV